MTNNPNKTTCPDCGGRGSQLAWNDNDSGIITKRDPCPKCQGSGQVGIVLAPGIYGQNGPAPIVMVSIRGIGRYWHGPYYLLSIGNFGVNPDLLSCRIWKNGIGARAHNYRVHQTILWPEYRLATDEEIKGIKEW
jgi:hypothetical protein